MQAIILAAGMGKRLKNLTKNNTKCMIKVNGVPLIDRMLGQLDRYNLSRIIMVVGYKREQLINHIRTLEVNTPIEYVINDIYDKTNNIYSLALAKKFLCEEDTLLLESDLIFEDEVIDLLIKDERKTLALVDKYESWMDGTCVKLNEDDSIEAFVPGKKFKFEEIKSYYKTVNIYKFSKYFSNTHYVPFLEAYQKALGVNEYYEQVLRVITMLDVPDIEAKRLNGQFWYEIDDIQDLDIAESMFVENGKDKVSLLSERYGGYWRYPQLLDFCYLVNPYFPTSRLIDEMKASFENLLTEYPSGMRVNSLLAGKNFNVDESNIVVGNGASELIKCLMDKIQGKVGVVKPTFEEYSNRCQKEDMVVFYPENEDYSYTVDELIDYFMCHRVDNIIIINPDNPSGNYLKKQELLKLIKWTKDYSIKMVVDESFVDFAEEKNATLINEEILKENPHLYVVKSISKSYGVPGLRLGVLASGNTFAIQDIKDAMPIWNINAFAEFYMQIAEKYSTDYEVAMDKFREERNRFAFELSKIKGIRVIPSQANYFMVELKNGTSAENLVSLLCTKYNILIKSLNSKIHEKGEYIRVAVRNAEDNDVFLEALREEFGSNEGDYVS